MRCIKKLCPRVGVNCHIAWLIVAAGIAIMGQGCSTPANNIAESAQTDTSAADQDNQKQTKSHYSAHIKDGTLTIKGNSGDSKLALRLKAGDATVLEVDVDDDGSADFSFDRGQFDHILVQGGKGNDVIRIDESNGVFTDTELTTIDGDEGDDTLIGGSGAETLIGGPGNDTINGGRGNDVVLLGEGDDTFIWNPGDGSDTVEGQAGTDKMVFNGANVAENIDISANGPVGPGSTRRVRFFRDAANITMDLDGVELIDFNALGGADNVVVNDLTGTDVTRVNVDLGATGGVSDGQPDAVTVNGTPGPDTFNISPDGDALIVNGLVRVKGFEPANDRIVVSGVGGDVVNVNGTDGADTINITLSPVAGFARVNIVGILTSVDVNGVTSLAIHGLGGPDTISGSNGLAALNIPLTLDGGPGDDVINGGDGDDVLIGGDGNDTIDGNRGNDVAFMGAGDDTFIWDPGDGSDTVEGQGGADKMVFNGANVDEKIDISANGPVGPGPTRRVRFFRNVANITMDLNGVEQIDFNALGGADDVVVNDLTGTDISRVNVDLGATGGVSDGQPDTVTLTGTLGPDIFNISPDGDALVVNGLVRVKGFEPADDLLVISGSGGDTVNVNGTDGPDTINITPSPVAGFARVNIVGISTSVDVTNVTRLVVNGLGGPDTISGSNGLAALNIPLTLDGGPGDDVINGGDGDDVLIGGDGNDTIDGNRGNDVALMGAGDDTFIWDPGDGSDTVEGQGGTDKMVFKGANIAEKIDISANGSRVRFSRDVASITMDLNEIERIDFNALGGIDQITVNDLTGTAVTQVNLDLASPAGSGTGDGAADLVIVNATNGNDVITVSGSAAAVTVLGLAAQVAILGGEAALDRLVVNALAGDDAVTASGLQATAIALTINGGDNDDVLIGGDGNDILNGGNGDDVLNGGPGNDTLDGGPGNNVLIQ